MTKTEVYTPWRERETWKSPKENVKHSRKFIFIVYAFAYREELVSSMFDVE
jgi:hypothetical protein